MKISIDFLLVCIFFYYSPLAIAGDNFNGFTGLTPIHSREYIVSVGSPKDLLDAHIAGIEILMTIKTKIEKYNNLVLT